MTSWTTLLSPLASLALAFASVAVPVASSGAPSPGAPSPGAPSRGPARPTPLTAIPVGRWSWPLVPRPAVLRLFAPPASAYGAGHRGVDLAAHEGQPVRAVAAGTVTHVGVLGGRGTVTVLHPSGVRSTYEPVEGSVTLGQVVAAGEIIGTLSAVGSHCAPDACLHLGAIRDGTYLDPLTLLTPGRVRLLPLE